MAPDAGSWTIQMGAFELRENAEELLARLEAAGLEAAIVSLELPDIGPRHLVRQGGLASRADAEATLSEIESALGIVGFIVPTSWPQPQ
jgi:cell division septation protein DedD